MMSLVVTRLENDEKTIRQLFVALPPARYARCDVASAHERLHQSTLFVRLVPSLSDFWDGTIGGCTGLALCADILRY